MCVLLYVAWQMMRRRRELNQRSWIRFCGWEKFLSLPCIDYSLIERRGEKLHRFSESWDVTSSQKFSFSNLFPTFFKSFNLFWCEGGSIALKFTFETQPGCCIIVTRITHSWVFGTGVTFQSRSCSTADTWDNCVFRDICNTLGTRLQEGETRKGAVCCMLYLNIAHYFYTRWLWCFEPIMFALSTWDMDTKVWVCYLRDFMLVFSLFLSCYFSYREWEANMGSSERDFCKSISLSESWVYVYVFGREGSERKKTTSVCIRSLKAWETEKT